MRFYQQFCEESYDAAGRLTGLRLKYRENYNFGYDVVDAIAAQDPQRPALLWCDASGAEQRLCFAEISRLSNQAARVLQAHGVRRGDKVMVMLKRYPEYWFMSIALHKLGAVLAPVTHMLTEEDIAYRVELAGVTAAICAPEDELLARFCAVRQRCPALARLFTVRRDAPGMVNLTARMAEAPETLARQQTRADEAMILYFTSGTTGYPKAVAHDHTYSLAHILTACHWQGVEEGGLHFTVAETGWGKASWGKLYGQWLGGAAVLVYDFENFDPKQLMNVIDRYRVTSFCAPPTVYRYLVKKGLQPLPSLRQATTAGEALSPDVFAAFRDCTCLTLREGYGQTESALILAHLAGSAAKPGSMGRPTPLYDVAVLREDGSRAADGEVGELVIIPPQDGSRQHGIFMAYCDDEALYRHAWRDGVYHTGDTVWRDADGDFWFNGRIDDVIKTGGFRVGPYEVEHVLLQHPAVLECSVIGQADQLRGQAIKAYVVPQAGYTADAALQRELREFANARLAQYKWIRELELVSDLPKTISGKVRRAALRG